VAAEGEEEEEEEKGVLPEEGKKGPGKGNGIDEVADDDCGDGM